MDQTTDNSQVELSQALFGDSTRLGTGSAHSTQSPASFPELQVLSGSSGGDDKRFHLLRALRVEVQDLRSVIELVQAGKITLQSQSVYLAKTKADLGEIQQQLEQDLQGDDHIHHLVNILEQMANCPLLADQPQPLPAQEQLNSTMILLAQIQHIELLVGLLTIPARLNQWLGNSKPGYYIPFHLVFRDEIPSEDDRRLVLNQIAWSPAIVKNGIVDVGNGLVFRFAEDGASRWRSVGWLVGAIIVSLLIAGGSAYLPLPGWVLVQAPQRATLFAIGWAAVLVGVIVHIGVAGVKREQETNLPTILAVTGLVETVDARLGQILWKLLLVLIGFFAVVFAIDPGVSPITAFLVGYSLDSFVGVFGGSLETKVNAVQTQLTTK